MGKKKFLFMFLLFPLFTYSELKYTNHFVDTSQLKGFKTLMYSKLEITNNGKYITYSKEFSLNDRNRKPSRVFKSLDGNWQIVIDSIAGIYKFTSNSKYAIFRKSDNNLCILKLGSDKIDFFHDVDEFRILLNNNEETVIAYTSRKNSSVTILNVDNKKKNL